MRCSKCKTKLPKVACFCPVCGTKVEKSSGKWTTFVWICTALGLCIGGVALGIFKDSRIPRIRDVDEAIEHAKELGDEYGYENAFSELTENSTTTVEEDNYYRLQQNYRGIPVYGRTLVYVTDERDKVLSITGNMLDVDESIELTPTVTESQIEETIEMYFLNELKITNSVGYDIGEFSDRTLCIWNFEDDGTAHLAYQVFFDGYEFIVNAQSGGMLLCKENIQSATGFAASDQEHTNGFHVEKNEDGLYQLVNSELKLYVYDLKGGNGKNVDNLAKSLPLTSTDLIFGNMSKEKNYEEGVCLYQNISKIKKYFNKTCGFNCWTLAYYNDSYDNGKNAFGAQVLSEDTDEFVGMVSMGSITGVNDIDVMSHEYGHVISKKNVDWLKNSVENKAINEGISDIFGEIVEAWYYEREKPDWIMKGDNIDVRRNIEDPSVTSHATHVKDSMVKNNVSEDEKTYYYSTVISHVGYLMWNGYNGNEEMKISTEDIIKMWYRAMLMMPSDCDFATCRKMVERAAISVDGLTKKQRQCIAKAFDKVGIEDVELSPEILVDCDFNIRPESDLKVYDIEGELHSNYTLEIVGTITENDMFYSSDFFTDVVGKYKQLVTIKKSAPYELELLNGYYTFTVTDENNPGASYSFTVSVSEQGTDDEIELHTEFKNQLLVILPDSTEDEGDDNALESYISAVEKTTKSGSWTEELDMSVSMVMTKGDYETKAKVSLNSCMDIIGYSPNNLSNLYISGDVTMSIMGQSVAWNVVYKDGIAHYQYTEPDKTSTDIEMDPTYFNFGTLTEDVMTDTRVFGNQIKFTVPGDKMKEAGLTAVNLMSGIEDLEYGDVRVIVTKNKQGRIDNITMRFDALLTYQGYNTEADYEVKYKFS